MTGRGSRLGNLIDHGIRFGLVEKSGSWFSLSTGDRLGQGERRLQR